MEKERTRRQSKRQRFFSVEETESERAVGTVGCLKSRMRVNRMLRSCVFLFCFFFYIDGSGEQESKHSRFKTASQGNVSIVSGGGECKKKGIVSQYHFARFSRSLACVESTLLDILIRVCVVPATLS